MSSAVSRPRPGTPAGTPADLAVIGGGQLARMMQQAAIGLGVRIRLLAEGPDVSAAQVIPDHIVGDHTNLDDLRAVVAGVPVVTFDHEHVPPEHLRTLEAEGHACRPGPDALIHAHDKGVMRTRLTQMAVPTPRWAFVESVSDLADFGFPAVVKTTVGGYDGKGVWVVSSPADADEAFASGRSLLAEELVDFRRELSALVARSPSGEVVAYPVVESRQADGVCAEVIAPAPDLDPALDAEGRAMAERIATELDVTGILAVELFETRDGRLLVNELAMRPHNTGHWSIDGARTSQFENHLRAVLDLPLGSTVAARAVVGDGQHPRRNGGGPRGSARDRARGRAGRQGPPLRQVGQGRPQGRARDGVRRRSRRRARPGPSCCGTVHRRSDA